MEYRKVFTRVRTRREWDQTGQEKRRNKMTEKKEK